MSTELDIELNRSTIKYSKTILLKRVAWGLAKILFHYSPRTFFSWRVSLLKIFGAKIGEGVHIYNSAEIYMPWNLEIGDWSSIGEHAYLYNLGLITVGSKTTISQRAHLCAGTHDYNKVDLPLLKPPIMIGDKVWICADVFVGPDVKIKEGSVVAARAVVVKDVDAWCVVAGNPAKYIKDRKIEND